MREAIVRYLSKSVEHRFENKLEITKAEIRAREREKDAQFAAKSKELESITGFLIELKKGRDSVIQAKRIEAAEITLRACSTYAQLTIAVEMMKVLNVKAISSRATDPKIQSFFNTLLVSMKVDEKLAAIERIDQILPKLYLNERTLAHFNAYIFVILHAISFMKATSTGLSADGLFIADALRKEVEKVVPASKDGFDKYGESHAYYWLQYLFDKVLSDLRSVANGVERDNEDAVAAISLTVTSQMTQLKVGKIVADLPEDLKNKEVSLPQ